MGWVTLTGNPARDTIGYNKRRQNEKSEAHVMVLVSGDKC